MYRVNSLVAKRFFSAGTSVPQFKKVGVVGLGLMGHGVAQVVAQAGFQVVAIESNADAMKAGLKRLEYDDWCIRNVRINPLSLCCVMVRCVRIDGSLGKVIAKDVQKGVLTEVNRNQK